MAQKTLDALTKIHHVDVVRHGDKLLLPEGMSVEDGIDTLERFRKLENTTIQKSQVFDVFPWDGAYNLDILLKRELGWTEQKPIQTMFGSKPPELINVDVGFNKTVQVPWGRMGLANVDGELFTSAEQKHGRWCFKLVANVKKKHEAFVQSLFEKLQKQCQENSIYKGKAIKIRFFADNGDLLPMPEPKFLRTDDVDETQLVYSKDVMSAIKTNLFTPIERVKDCIANGLPVKRGILLGGPFGTGKTMAAKVASKKAVENGVTYIYIARAAELAEAINFAKQYPDPAAVVFCEDIDRAFNGTERNVKVDDILNTIDGIDSKSLNLIVVLTTNNIENISQAMLRPGRLDAVIEVTPPDAEAVQRLLRVYGRGVINDKTDLTRVGQLLEGVIPAVIAEVVQRAKLSQLSLQERGTKVTDIGEPALLEAAKTMEMQLRLLDPKNTTPSEAELLHASFQGVVRTALNGTKEQVVNTLENSRKIGREMNLSVN